MDVLAGGISPEKIAILPVRGVINNIWSLRFSPATDSCFYMIVSSVLKTRILKFGIESPLSASCECPSGDLLDDRITLYCSSISSSSFIQVTSSRIVVLEKDCCKKLHEYVHEGSKGHIISAHSRGENAVIATTHDAIVFLKVSELSIESVW